MAKSMPLADTLCFAAHLQRQRHLFNTKPGNLTCCFLRSSASLAPHFNPHSLFNFTVGKSHTSFLFLVLCNTQLQTSARQ